MKASNSAVPVYTISGSEARPLPEWLIRQRKRSLKNDPEFANRVELLQDFSFEEASQCVRATEDGDWVMSTGTYKPQIHTHYLPHLSLSFARHTSSLNQTFRILSSDFSKSIHLQSDRTIELHTRGGLHHSIRIPRYGRDLITDRRTAEILVPSVGLNAEGMGECFRLDLQEGRFKKSYEVDLGREISGGGLQGGIDAPAVTTGAIAEESHGLLALGTSIGTVELFDSRSRNRAGILSIPQDTFAGHSGVSAITFRRSGLDLAIGDSTGITRLYDLRSPEPIVTKDQGYGFAVQNIIYLESGTQTQGQVAEPKILTSDKRIIKLWDPSNGTPFTSVEPAVDLNHVEWCKDTGMLLTANEGKQQHAFFIPQLGPAPRWCSFLDNIVEEMAEDQDDPNAFGKNTAGDTYDNFKFCTTEQLQQLELYHLRETTSLLRPYMHGYFVPQKLYEEARLISNPDLWQEQRAKSIAEKINKERESRIRGNKKVAVKVNRKLAEKMLERQDKADRKRAKRLLEKGGDENMPDADADATAPAVGDVDDATKGVLTDPRFARMFEDEDFEVDERSHEFRAINPSTKIPKGLTAAEQEDLDSSKSSSEDSSASEAEAARPSKKKPPTEPVDKNRVSSSAYRKAGHESQRGPNMLVSSSKMRKAGPTRDKSFGARVSKLKERAPDAHRSTTTVVGEREITFAPEQAQKQRKRVDAGDAPSYDRRKQKDRRPASNNAFRGM